MYRHIYQSPAGVIILGATELGICEISWANDFLGGDLAPWGSSSLSARSALRTECDSMTQKAERWLRLADSQLTEYFQKRRAVFTLPLDLRGTPFQLSVWRELLRIPWGETRSYADIARAIARPAAVRAVGNANGKNPICIVVPCHRVIAMDRSLGGYSGGIRSKQFLLGLEEV